MIENYFYNEYLIKLNRYTVYSKNVKKPLFSILTNHRESRVYNLFYKLAYSIISYFGFFFLFFKKKVELSLDQRDIILFADGRALKVIVEKEGQIFTVGLRKVLLQREPSILLILNWKELFNGYILFRKILSEKKNNDVIFNELTYINSVRVLDLVLFEIAASKLHDKTIHYSGHFDHYISVLSHLRESRRVDFKLNCYQHGVFEKSKGHSFKKIFCDTYTLLFKESEDFFISNLSKNRDCVIITNVYNSNITARFSCKDSQIIVLAFQNDNFQLDKLLLNEILKSSKIKPLVYLHPATSKKIQNGLRQQYPDIDFFLKERFSNVDILITRYSTIGIDYLKLGVKTYFIPFGYEICIFNDKLISKNVISLEELKLKL